MIAFFKRWMDRIRGVPPDGEALLRQGRPYTIYGYDALIFDFHLTKADLKALEVAWLRRLSQ